MTTVKFHWYAKEKINRKYFATEAEAVKHANKNGIYNFRLTKYEFDEETKYDKLIESKDVVSDKPNKIKLTAPQQELWEQLQRGRKVCMINTNRMSGGDFVWTDSVQRNYPGNSLFGEAVGYKVFWSLMYKMNIEDAKEFFEEPNLEEIFA